MDQINQEQLIRREIEGMQDLMPSMKIRGCFREATEKKFVACSGYCDWPGHSDSQREN